MESKVYTDFLGLVRAGIGHVLNVPLSDIYWPAVRTLAEQQGLYAVILDGIERLKDSKAQDVQGPPQETLLEWIGEVLQDYEYRYEQYGKAISELAHFYNSHGYKMMVLKGYACSLDWPKPNHRLCGDIDIWQFGEYKKTDTLLQSEKGIKVDKSHHHHTVFNWGDFIVENHYDFINVHHHKSHVELEQVLKEFGTDDTHYVELSGDKVYLPSPNLHALFLMKHLVLHFTTGEITLRQILDWAFFLEKHGKEVDWNRMLHLYTEFHILDFCNCINAICIEDLDFKPSIFPYVQFNPFMKNRVLNDILNPKFSGEIPQNLFTRLYWKIRRWNANKWKHELCYKETLWSAFWSGVWNHILKPSSI